MTFFFLRYAKRNHSLFYKLAHLLYDGVRTVQYNILYYVFRLFPIKNRIVATAFNGCKYGDNSKFIIEKVHEIEPDIEIVWLIDPSDNYKVPDYVKLIKCTDKKNIVTRCFFYYTSKIWINTHLYDKYLRKSDNQLVIETWHGGLGIKKIEGDVEKFSNNIFQYNKILATSKLADVFISNSAFLSKIFRRAFFYKGTIWNIGFPKDDIFFQNDSLACKKVREWFGLKENVKMIVYAPTYRGIFEDTGVLDMKPYNIDLERVRLAFEKKFECSCVIIIRWHPSMTKYVHNVYYDDETIFNGSSYPEMQDIIASCSAFISDYSSCIFEAALKNVPCFIYANDFEDYIGDRGTYFKLGELPFPWAETNDELIKTIETYNSQKYRLKWESFQKDMGLCDRGIASKNIAMLLIDYCKNQGKALKLIKKDNDCDIDLFYSNIK